MNRLSLLFLTVFVFAASCLANTGIGAIKGSFTRTNNKIFFNASDAALQLEFAAPGVVRVRVSWTRQFAPVEKLMLVDYVSPVFDITTQTLPGYFLFTTQQLQVRVYKNPARIDMYTAAGKLLSSEKLTGIANTLYKQGDTVGCIKQCGTDEHFFGFGERMDFIDRRGKNITLNVGRGKGLPHLTGAYNILEANYSPVPFFMSTKGYGIFLHNAHATEWNMGTQRPDQYRFSAAGGELDYFFFYGPSFPAILDSYTRLTGRAPLMPLFALGLHVGTYSGGTWGYEQLTSDTYVVELARKLRSLGIPADLLWLDSTWRLFGTKGGKGATTFEWRETFKNPKAMFDSVYQLQYKMVGLHLRPRFDDGQQILLLDSAQKQGFTYPENGQPGEFVNFFDSNAVNWWWQHGVMRVASLGAKFLKTDEGSAFGGLANESDKTGPTDVQAKALHNVFPIAYAKAPYEKFQSFNGIRGMNHTREGYAGIQRYPFIFAGDWPSEWQYFAPVIKAGLNIGVSGVSYWGHCMGGFEHVADPELYVRWCQFGMFSPVAMVFGMDHPAYKEPWRYGPEVLQIFKKYDSLRYRLLPYIYSNCYKTYTTGMPLMQALVLNYQDDENVYEIGDQYMFGESMMVCPVTTKGAQTRTVYLPAGNWYNYWTSQQYTGKQYVQVVTPLDQLPLFVKAGSIIPLQPGMTYIGEKPVDVITLDIFPADNTAFDLYEDDGQTLQYQQGQYAITKMRGVGTQKQFTITIPRPVGNYQPVQHTYALQVRLATKPAAVTENGKPVSNWQYDDNQKILYIQTLGSNREAVKVEVRGE